jgi:hypothetical protein
MKKANLLFIFLLTSILTLLPLSQSQAATLIDRVKGRVLLQVQQHGEAWYVNPVDGKMTYLYNGDVAYGLMKTFGLGIKTADLNKIPVGVIPELQSPDSDGDGLGDYLEVALGLNDLAEDTDGDGYKDGQELRDAFNPLGPGKLTVDKNLVNRLKGRILIQVEKNGEAWYIYPVDGRRYYLHNGRDAYGLMKYLGLGVSDADIGKLPTDKDHPDVYKYLIENTYPTGTTTYTYQPVLGNSAGNTSGSSSSGSSGSASGSDNLTNTQKSLALGLVHYNYYGDLGGNSGTIFKTDQTWAAKNVDLGIIGWGDTGMDAAWTEIKRNQPQGKWLKWRLAQVMNTYEAAGTCDRPLHGAVDQSFNYQKQEFDNFLKVYTHYGDGETCFLHAQNDGTMKVNWQAQGCQPTLSIKAGQRIETIIWSEYGWLFDLNSDCAKDFIAWRTVKDIWSEGFSGVGFDNLGSPLGDGYYLPDMTASNLDIIEIDNSLEKNKTSLNNWYYETVRKFMDQVNSEVQKKAPGAKIVYNGGAYCSWDGGVAPLKKIIGYNIGVWCENALEYPSWGAFDTPSRLRTLIDLSSTLNNNAGFTVLETLYNHGNSEPTAPEMMFYLAAYYNYKNGQDVLALKPSWNPYRSFKDNLWFDIFNRDLGQATAKSQELNNGIFIRSYHKTNGQEALVLVRVDGTNDSPVIYYLNGNYCQVDINNKLKAISNTIEVKNGDGLILLKKGAGDVDC